MHFRALLLLVPLIVSAQPFSAPPPGRILASGDNRIVIFTPDGKIAWEYPTKLTHDVWLLDSGNILYADGQSVTEVSPEKKVIWQYTSETKKSDATYGCQRLPSGNTLVCENATGKVLEVDPAGKIVFTLQTAPFKPGHHHNLRLARKLDNGNYLVCHSGEHLVKEYKPEGAVVLELKVPDIAFCAIRTPAGTTLVSSLGRITEFDKDGKSIWEFATKDARDLTITQMTGMHLQPDGSLVVGCYSAYTKEGKGSGLLHITRDRKVTWTFSDPKFSRHMMAVQQLDESGKPLSGPCIR